MKSQVLILGAKGTLGQALVKQFNSDYQIVAWDKEDCDVMTPEGLAKIEKQHPKIIINSTALNAVDKIETDPIFKKFGYDLNGRVPGQLAEIAKKIGAYFVHYSTNYVFDGEKASGYLETDPPSPINEYGKSKLAGETAVQKVGGNYYIIRLSRLFGIRGTGETSKRTFVEIMQSEIEKTELEVGSSEISGITYAPDLAKLTAYLIENNLPSGIYHGTNSGVCSWADWASEIFRILGKGPKVIPVDSKTPKTTRHPLYGTLLNTKLPLQRAWQEALQEFLK